MQVAGAEEVSLLPRDMMVVAQRWGGEGEMQADGGRSSETKRPSSSTRLIHHFQVFYHIMHRRNKIPPNNHVRTVMLGPPTFSIKIGCGDGACGDAWGILCLVRMAETVGAEDESPSLSIVVRRL
mmetsp:Transcript_12967/g.28166  ORF Transcript_12967/g.28166 Transcript_12967/m.28166 type:complete len:125 (-) Transcript_12967:311-685(-)